MLPALPGRAWLHLRLARLDAQLKEAGTAISPRTVLLVNGAAVALGAVLAAAVSPLLAIVGLAAGAVAPHALLRRAVARSQARADHEALTLLRLVAAHLRTGATYVEAVRSAAEGVSTAQVRDELAWVANRFRLDQALHRSLAEVASRTPGRNLRLVYRVLARSAESSVPGQRGVVALEGLEATIAANLRAREELQAKTRGIRLQVFVVALAIPAIFLYLRWSNPGAFTVLDQPLGRFVLLPGAVVLLLLGLLLWRRFSQVLA